MTLMYGYWPYIRLYYIIKTLFYSLKTNKRTNKKYLCNALLLTYLHL